MDAWLWIVIGVAAVVAVVVVAFLAWQGSQRSRSSRLRNDFGSVYDETVTRFGDKKAAEQELRERQERVERLHLRPLTPEEKTQLEREFADIQSGFIDNPRASANDADQLIDRALTRRGYPKADFERRLDDLSVEHPEVVRRYRAARMLVVKEDGDTEMLRKALIEYRTVFVELANADVQMPAVPDKQQKQYAKAS